MLLEQEVGVDVADLHARHRVLDALYVADQLVFGQVLAQQHLVTHRQNVGVTRAADFYRCGDLALIDLPVSAEPGADKGL